MSTDKSDGRISLKELITRRSSIKGQITKFKNYLDKISKIQFLSNIESAELSLKINKFESLSTKFDDLQSQIEVINCDNLEFEIDERDNIEQDIIITLAKSKTLLKGNTSDESRASADCSDEDAGVKLPLMQIAKFDGSFLHWLEFRDTFLNLIHNNNKIPTIQKFHYLESYLEGEAAHIISNLEKSSDNYTVAWKLLCARFDNKRLLKNNHFKALFNLPQLNRESEKSFRFIVTHVTKNLRALSSLGQPTDKWDQLIIFLVSTKLDNRTQTKWEERRNFCDEEPTLEQFFQFLNGRADILESVGNNKLKAIPSSEPYSSTSTTNNKTYNKKSNTQNTKSFQTFSKNTPTYTYTCVICSQPHKIYDCPLFKSKSVSERWKDITKYKLCINCLRYGHSVESCKLGPCRECKKKHNSLLHNPAVTSTDISNSELSVNFSEQNQQVLLSTALIEIKNPHTNKFESARALLDCGSQSSFICQSLKDKLSLPTTPIDVKIIGIGNNNVNNVTESCSVHLRSLNSDYNVSFSCLVMEELTGDLPKGALNLHTLNIPKYFKLADPQFHKPSKIEVLIGSDIFWDILQSEQKSLGPNKPLLRNSQLGWLVVGPVTAEISYNVYCNHASYSKSCQDIDDMLTNFWKLDELPQHKQLSKNEIACENHFLHNTKRLSTGRFSVRLPLLESPECLGESYNLAKKRFYHLERRFSKSTLHKIQYSMFIREYADLNHLSLVTHSKPNSYYLCHHAVFKENSESTKLRVVFDGSAPTSSGFSLNDIMMIGPNVQDSLFFILVRARQYKYILTGDIAKMYRQVEVDQADRNLQLILWRDDPSLPLKTLQLNTVTYGTASASYLSTKCLWQVGEQCHDEVIKTIIQKDFYVDDLITGADDEAQLHYIQKAVTDALNSACFKLRKFKSNLPSLYENLNEDAEDNLTFSESSNTLGLSWNPSNDNLSFPLKDIPNDVNITKRFILSNSFKIFDPLGILSPIIIIPKIIVQDLWKQKIDWDQNVPQNSKDEWLKFCQNFQTLKQLQVPRRVICDSPTVVEIHSFCDASQKAYGACIYVRSINSNNQVFVNLLCSKSKVSPLKPVTMPRLELCAALIGARLCNSVIESLRYKPNRITHWCDSKIVLAWLNSHPARLKIFVANRVSEINELTLASNWRYVPSHANPADLISRGEYASKLIASDLWWTGPDFLYRDECEWPTNNYNNIEVLPEIKSTIAITSLSECIIIQNYSSLTKLQRTLAFVKRFIFNLRNPNNKRSSILSLEELNDSFNSLCLLAQTQSFSQDYDKLINHKPLSPKSKLIMLSPFIDDNKLMRVGGRINISNYTYDKKHPILLDSSHHLTKLIFEREHKRSLHAGPQLLLSIIRETIWPINGRNLARNTVRKCVVCRRFEGKTLTPKMGNLPSQRITTDFPFVSVGIDFAGPFFILNRKGRGAKLLKCYLCLFICLRFKCVHLEAVSELSKDAFILTLNRFISRRGRPIEIFCDNGRNFVAAAKEIGKFIKSNSNALFDYATHEGFKFVFMPPYAPHFGGIWEAGVKSAKFHIKRVLGNTHLTYEELSTLFTQVEAIMNSRPLCPLSTSPNDFLSLSPGHFLIGRRLTSLPSPVLDVNNESQLSRYQRMERIRQHFWRRWQTEYIGELQQRTKWKANHSSLNVGDLVLVQEDNVPPLSWRLGRVAQLIHGPDGIARVADINTTRGCIRRPLVRLCPLPNAEELQA